MVDETQETELDGSENEQAEIASENEEAEQQAQAESKKRNRTTEYINRLKAENAELRQLAAQLHEQEPSYEDDYDAGESQQPLTEERWRQLQQEAAEQQRQQQAQARDAELVNTFRQRAASVAAEHPDFEEAVATMSVPLPESVQRAIMAHENGAALLYQAAKDDALAEELAMVNDNYATKAVDKAASRFTATPQAQTNQRSVSNAPAPIERMSGNAPTTKNEDDMSEAEWTAMMRAKRAKQRG